MNKKFKRVIEWDMSMLKKGKWGDFKTRGEALLNPFVLLFEGFMFILFYPLYFIIVFCQSKKRVYWEEVKYDVKGRVGE